MAPTFPCLGNCGAILWSRRQLAHHYRSNQDCRSALVIAQTAIRQPVSLSPTTNLWTPSAIELSSAPNFQSSEGPEVQVESPAPSQQNRRSPVTVEEIEDEEAIAITIDGNEFTTEYLPRAGEAIGDGKSERVVEYEKQIKNQDMPWAPFPSYKEWELAEWLVQSGVSQSNIEKLLKLQWVSRNSNSMRYWTLTFLQIKEHTEPLSFKNKDSFLKKLDSLPTGPQWERTEITVTGDLFDDAGEVLTEQLEIWRRDPVELVKELIGNPSFRKNLQFAPVRLRNRRNAKRVFNEAWTADWWWTVQVCMYNETVKVYSLTLN